MRQVLREEGSKEDVRALLVGSAEFTGLLMKEVDPVRTGDKADAR